MLLPQQLPDVPARGLYRTASGRVFRHRGGSVIALGDAVGVSMVFLSLRTLTISRVSVI